MQNDRQLTESREFFSLTLEQQEEKVHFLREKRKNLQPRNKKTPKPIKLPSFEFVSQQHKLCFLSLPRIYQKLF